MFYACPTIVLIDKVKTIQADRIVIHTGRELKSKLKMKNQRYYLI